MSKENPCWKASVPIWTDKAVLEDLFIEATERLIIDKFEPKLNAAQQRLRIEINDNKDALSLSGDLETIYIEMLHDTCFLLAALAPHLGCKPLTHESLLTDAIKAAQLARSVAEDQPNRTPQQDTEGPFGPLAYT